MHKKMKNLSIYFKSAQKEMKKDELRLSWLYNIIVYYYLSLYILF